MVCVGKRSSIASLLFKGLATQHTALKNWITLAEVIIQVKNNVMLILVQSPVV